MPDKGWLFLSESDQIAFPGECPYIPPSLLATCSVEAQLYVKCQAHV